MCLVGEKVDREFVQFLLSTPDVGQCFPPNMRLDQDFCHCSPRMSAQGAVQPFADRIGKLIFAIVRQIQKRRLARRAVLRTITREQQKEGGHRRLSMVM